MTIVAFKSTLNTSQLQLSELANEASGTSVCGSFVEMHSFHRVSGDLAESKILTNGLTLGPEIQNIGPYKLFKSLNISTFKDKEKLTFVVHDIFHRY